MVNKKNSKRKFVISGELTRIHIMIFLVLCLVFVRGTRLVFGDSGINNVDDYSMTDDSNSDGEDNGLLLGSNNTRGNTEIVHHTIFEQNPGFERTDISMCNPDDDNKCIIMMDRNLGATNTGVGATAPSTSYGYYYQWGNNYGFTYVRNWSNYIGYSSEEYTHNGFYSDYFFFNTGNISFNPRTNLWGGEGDINLVNLWDTSVTTGRQGPCPEGYHIPSAGEWRKLYQFWHYSKYGEEFTGIEINNDSEYFEFLNDFQIPLAGYINRNKSKLFVGTVGIFWSSTANRGARAYSSSFSGNVGYFGKADPSVNAYSLRCFKNVYNIFENFVLSFDTNGGTSIEEQTVVENERGMRPEDPQKSGYIFDDWYSDEEFIEKYDFESSIVKDTVLYAKWKKLWTISFNTNGGLFIDDQIVEDYGILYEPIEPVKEGQVFLGWYSDEQFIQQFDFENTVITGDITLYAKWEACPEGYKSINNRCIANSAGIYYESGVIRITNGNGKTIYIKDRNQGAENSGYMIHQLAILDNEYATCYGTQGLPTEGLERGVKNNSDVDQENCRSEEEILGDMGDLLGIENPTPDEISEYIFEYLQSMYGNYYYRGNNNGATYDELSGGIVDELLYLRGFDSGKIGEDNTGWGEGENGNPCDSSKGEYLPTMSDWKDALDIWGEVNGMGNEYEEGQFIPWRFFDDILVPGGYFSLYDEGNFDGGGLRVKSSRVIYNQENNKNLLALLLSNPVYAYEDKRIVFYGNFSLWGTDSNISNILEGGLQKFSQSDTDTLNAIAAPVRCFIKNYNVNFNTDGGSAVEKVEVVGNQIIQEPDQPKKLNYTFGGWYTDSGFVQKYDFSQPVSSDLTLYAKWEKNNMTSGNGGGGGGSSLKKDNCPNGDYSDSYYDGDCGSNSKEENKQQHNSSEEVIYDTLVFNPHYSDEQNQAYQYAYHYGITTKAPISNADIDGNLTRIAMAKMLSQYAINVLGMKPDKSRNNQFKDVTDKLDGEYDDGVTLAYQLGIMGINMPNNEFRPNDLVPRAEFVTALSRLLYKTPDGMFEETPRYYIPHMEKLIYEGIISNPDPKMLELRGYVMLMLMRSDK